MYVGVIAEFFCSFQIFSHFPVFPSSIDTVFILRFGFGARLRVSLRSCFRPHIYTIANFRLCFCGSLCIYIIVSFRLCFCGSLRIYIIMSFRLHIRFSLHHAPVDIMKKKQDYAAGKE